HALRSIAGATKARAALNTATFSVFVKRAPVFSELKNTSAGQRSGFEPNQKRLRVGSRDRLIGGCCHGVHLSWLSQGLVLDCSFAMTIGEHRLTTKHETVVFYCH